MRFILSQALLFAGAILVQAAPAKVASVVGIGTPTGTRAVDVGKPTGVCPPRKDDKHYDPIEQPCFSFEQLYKLHSGFFDNFIYPKNDVQAKMINSTILAENSRGRADVTRNFIGRELNTEYLFGLFSTLASSPDKPSLLGVPVSYDITQFTANQNIASASTIVQFNVTFLNLLLPVQISTVISWNAHSEISQYDSNFKLFQWTLDTVMTKAAPLLGLKTLEESQVFFQKNIAKSVCETAMTYCTGLNEQYTSQAQCENHLTTETRFGKAYEAGQNTLLCRSIHQNLVQFRPSVHCSHIGPSGGMYCVDDITYAGAIMDPLFTLSPLVPFGFQNPNATIAAA